MAIELIAEGPLTLGRPLALSPPQLHAVVIGQGITFTPGEYSEPVALSWRLFRDGAPIGDEGYVPVVSDEARRFVLLETATGARGIAQTLSGQVGTDAPITGITPISLSAGIVAGEAVGNIVGARGTYQHPSGIVMRRLVFLANGVEVSADYLVAVGDELQILEVVEANSGARRTFATTPFVVSGDAAITFSGEVVTYLGEPVTYSAA